MNTNTTAQHGVLVNAVERALRAPSVHNTQPWRWYIADGRIELYADRTRHLVGTDPDQRDLLLSCGAALHHLRVALAAAGVAVLVDRLPDLNRTDLLAVVRPGDTAPDDEDAGLAAAIEERRTDRRAFAGPPEPAELRRLATLAARHGARLHLVHGGLQRARFRAVLGEAATRQRQANGYPAELAMWTRRYAGARDGIPQRQRTRSTTDEGLRWFPSGSLEGAPPAPGSDTESDALAVLTTPGDSPEDRLRAGEATSAVLLGATRMGLASTPLSQATEVEQTRNAVARVVAGADDRPQLVLRFGRPPAYPVEIAATPRRPLSWVLTAPREVRR